VTTNHFESVTGILVEVAETLDQDPTGNFDTLETLGPKTQNPQNFTLKVTGDALRKAIQLGPSFSFKFHL
jgi:hypothetical protein